MKPGQIVFVYTSETLRIARVLFVHTGKVEVEHPGGDRSVYGSKRLARVSDRIVPSAAALEAYEDEVYELKGHVDLSALWEMLAADDAGRQTEAGLAGIALPDAGSASDDAMAWALFEDSVYFKRRKDGLYALNSAAAVEERRRRQADERRAAEEVVAMVAWLQNPAGPRPPHAQRALGAIMQMVVFDDTSRGAKLGRELIQAAYPDDAAGDWARGFQVMIDLGGWTADENLSLRRSGLPAVWPPGLVEHARQRAETTPGRSRGVDLRHLPTVAVDDEYTTEVDDALTIVDHGDGTRTAAVFITDVSEWVEAGGPLDEEARHRGSTLYIPEGKVPMLPEVLCDGVASLAAGEDRGALAFSITLDADGQILDFDVEEAVVNLDARLTYEQADAIVAGEPHALSGTVCALAAAADQLRRHRILGGSITLDRRDTAIHLEPDSSICVRRYRTDDPAYRMVAEWMIQTCACAAAWCRDQDIPAVYRTQPPPNGLELSEPLDGPIPAWRRHQILRTLRKAELSTEPGPHSSLGVRCYTQVTSPLRRYQDLIMHRQIKGFLRAGQPPLTDDDLIGVFAEVEAMQSAHSLVEKESRRYWLIKAVAPRVGQEVEIEVLREIGSRYLVELMGTGLVLTWSTDRAVQLGERLQVRLQAADARGDVLRLES